MWSEHVREPDGSVLQASMCNHVREEPGACKCATDLSRHQHLEEKQFIVANLGRLSSAVWYCCR